MESSFKIASLSLCGESTHTHTHTHTHIHTLEDICLVLQITVKTLIKSQE